jgi:predicted RNase H-like HicB family nuclease
MKMKATKQSVRRFKIVLQPEPEGGFTVTVPTLPGCVTYGETYEEALRMANDAIKGYIASLKKHGEPIPRESASQPLVTSLTLQLHP